MNHLRERALRLLAGREHTRAELARKLSADGTEDEIEAVLRQLESSGLLSDTRAVDAFVMARGARFGALRLRQELRRKGVNEELIDGALDGITESELARAREVWRRKFGQPPVDDREYACQARFLAGRGFAHELIRRLLKEPAQ